MMKLTPLVPSYIIKLTPKQVIDNLCMIHSNIIDVYQSSIISVVYKYSDILPSPGESYKVFCYLNIIFMYRSEVGTECRIPY